MTPDPRTRLTDGIDHPKVHQSARLGFVHSGLAQLLKLSAQTAGLIIVSRLLSPSQIGIMAMVAPLLAFAVLLQDIGLTQAIVQRSRLTHAELNAIFYFTMLASTLTGALLLLMSVPAGIFYGEGAAAQLTAALAIVPLISGIAAVPGALLNREMRFRALGIIDVAAAVISVSATIAVALLFRSFWALYVGVLVSALVLASANWACAGWKPTAPSNLKAGMQLLTFGANVSGFNIANYFARNLDNVLIGRYLGDRQLGLYDRAYKLLLFPLQQINAPVSRVMLPLLSRLNRDDAAYGHAYFKVYSLILVAAFPAVAFFGGMAEDLFTFALGDQWIEAAPIFAVLSFGSFLQILNNPCGVLFMSQDRTREFMFWGFFNAFTTVVGFLIGLPNGAIGVAIAYVVGELIRTPLLWLVVTRKGPIRLSSVVTNFFPFYLAAGASLAAVYAVRYVEMGSGAAKLLTGAITSYLVFFVVLTASRKGRGVLAFAWRQAKQGGGFSA